MILFLIQRVKLNLPWQTSVNGFWIALIYVIFLTKTFQMKQTRAFVQSSLTVQLYTLKTGYTLVPTALVLFLLLLT